MYFTTFDPFGRDFQRQFDRLARYASRQAAVLPLENDKFFVRERTMGTFTRRLRLPETLNAEAVEASYANGVLEVKVPVLEQAQPRKIEVRKVEIAQADGKEEIAA
jgi:hypothetical protein